MTVSIRRHACRADWLFARRPTYGMTDISAICRMNDYRGPYAVWAERQRPDIEPPTNQRMELGTAVQDAILILWLKTQPDDVRVSCRMFEHTTVHHADYPLLHASPDAHTDTAAIEVKNLGPFTARQWRTDGPPMAYQLQAVGNAIMADKTEAILVANLANDGETPIAEWRTDITEEWRQRFDEAYATVVAFHEAYVVTGIAPPMDDTAGSMAMPRMLWPTTDPRCVELGDRADSVVEQYEALGRVISDAEKERKELQAQIYAWCEGANAATTPNYTLKITTVNKKGHEVKPSSYPLLTVKKIRETPSAALQETADE